MEAMRNLTTLIAAHGVYAMSVIFIFYQQRRAYQNLREASAGHDRQYFRRVHVSVIVATYVLVLLSTIVWFYATFVFQPVKLIKGEVTGLSKPFDEASDADVVKLHQQLTPERVGDLDFYPVNDVPTVTTGQYRFRWVLLSREDLRQIAFRFAQESEAPAEIHPLAEPVPGVNTTTMPPRIRKRSYVEKRFILDLDALHYSPTRAIHLKYEPDHNDPANLGSLWLNSEDANTVEIKWAETKEPVQPKRIATWIDALVPTLFAAIGAPSVFSKDGSYNAEAGRALQLQLGSDELRTRLNARQILIQSGSSSFRFISDVLDSRASAQSVEWALLLDSLSKAVNDIELQGARFPSAGHLKLAAASYDVSDYHAAAFHFDKAGDALTKGQPLHLAMRAHAYLETERYSEAISILDQYLAADISQQNRAWARNALGSIYHRLGRWNDAVRERKEALRLAPGSVDYLNNLAYTYAKQGASLGEALALIERAGSLEPADPNIWETRGYILFRLGRVGEGLELIRKASVKLPNDPDTQRDLKEIETALGNRTRRFNLPAEQRSK